MQLPVVSVIVPTKNSSETLGRCLESISSQTYPKVEIVVVDNFSKDDTQSIAKLYTKHVYSKGPERSAQTNYGVARSTGTYVYKVDSDFILEPTVIEECVALCSAGADAVVVHNSPDPTVSWVAKIRRFEVDMYKYDLAHSSARFVKKSLYEKVDGFNPKVTAGEDYDFQNKLNRAHAKIGYADAEALHLGEPRHLWSHLKKYFEYGKDFVNYTSVASTSEKKTQLGLFRPVYLRNWKRFIRHPILGASFIGYNSLKYISGGLGYAVALSRKK